MISIASQSERETLAFAKFLARYMKAGQVIALWGDLGSGKTTFVKGLARGLKLKSRVVSPTFVIVLPHRIAAKKLFYHLDLYRLSRTADLAELGLGEILHSPKHITAIEWPGRIRKLLPRDTIHFRFKHGKKPNERIISLWQKN